jgi:hypothetical protein
VIRTFYQQAGREPAPMFTPSLLTDPLTGPAPTWRTAAEPISREQAGHGTAALLVFVALLAVVVLALAWLGVGVAVDVLDFVRTTPVFPSVCDGQGAP